MTTIISRNTISTRFSREQRAGVRPVSQVLLTCVTDEVDAVAGAARNIVLHWIQDKALGSLEGNAWEGEPFAVDRVGAQRAEGTCVDSYWSARSDDQDKQVAGRTWVTEVTVAAEDDQVLFGARLFNSTNGEDSPFNRTLPGFVRQVVASADFRIDKRKVHTAPWLVDSQTDVEEFVDFLTDPERKFPITVFSLPESSRDPADAALPAERILMRAIGAAHIAVLTGPASQMLTEAVGKEWSVFHRAVRTYWPKVDLDSSDPYRHSLATWLRIMEWEGGADGFGNLLVESLLRSTVSNRHFEAVLPTYAQVKQMRREQRRATESESSSSEGALAAQEEALRKEFDEELADLEGVVRLTAEERDKALSELDGKQGRIDALNARIMYLESLPRDNASSSAWEPEIPDSFDELEEWGKRHLAGKVVLLPRAIREARRAEFEDVPLAYQALLLLRDYYVPMKREGGSDKRRAYDEALRELGLEDSQSTTKRTAGEAGKTYYRSFEGQEHFLDRHLKKGNSREERYGFRLYFFWDDNTEQVVVGHLPSHLDHPTLS